MKYATLLVSLALLACSAATEPRAATLFVENATCDTACAPIEILAFPTNQPSTPGGMWSIEVGRLTARSGCFALPPSATFTVSSNGATEATYRWTLRDAVALGTPVAPAGRLQATPSTPTFVPASSRGWRVRLPGPAQPSASEPCTP